MRSRFEEPEDTADEPVTLTERQLRALKRGATIGLFAMPLALVAVVLAGWTLHQGSQGVVDQVSFAAQPTPTQVASAPTSSASPTMAAQPVEASAPAVVQAVKPVAATPGRAAKPSRAKPRIEAEPTPAAAETPAATPAKLEAPVPSEAPRATNPAAPDSGTATK